MEVYNAMPEHPTLSDYQQLFDSDIRGHSASCPLETWNLRQLCDVRYGGILYEVNTPIHVCRPDNILMAIIRAVFDENVVFVADANVHFAHTKLCKQRVFLRINYDSVTYIKYDVKTAALVYNYDINPVTRYLFWYMCRIANRHVNKFLSKSILREMHDFGFLSERNISMKKSPQFLAENMCLYCCHRKIDSYYYKHNDLHYNFYHCVLGAIKSWSGSYMRGSSTFDSSKIMLTENYLKCDNLELWWLSREIFRLMIAAKLSIDDHPQITPDSSDPAPDHDAAAN